MDGHDPFGADKHPAAIGSTLALEIGLVGGVAAAVGAVVFVRWRKLRLRNAVQAPEKQKA